MICQYSPICIFTWCEYHSPYYQTFVFGESVWLVSYATTQPVSPRMTVKLYCILLASSMSVVGSSGRSSLLLSWAHHAPVWDVPESGISQCEITLLFVSELFYLRLPWRCGCPTLMLSCEAHASSMGAALWMSQCSGSAIMGQVIWMSQRSNDIVYVWIFWMY